MAKARIGRDAVTWRRRRALGLGGRTKRVPLPRRPKPEGRALKPRAWMLVGVLAIGVTVFLIAARLIGNPVTGLTQLIDEARATFAFTPAVADSSSPLVPRPAGREADLVTAPSLLGIQRALAQERAAAAGVTLRVDEVFSDVAPAGLVLSQAPPQGAALARGDAVAVTISAGRAAVSVPSVVGLPAAQARPALEGRGLQTVELLEFSPDVAGGIVLRQEPLAGSVVDRRSLVAITISRGIEAVSVPVATGRTEDDARRAIELAGLSVGTVMYRESGGVPNGMVETQAPVAGATAPKGSPVNLTIVRVGEVAVPALVGLSLAAAERELQDYRLVVGAMSRVPAPGETAERVIGQEPGPEAKVPRGFGLRLLIAIPGPTPTPTPADQAPAAG
ncbi:MAG: PASTA domain-containing protein [Actinobacteria bacterium]|nr:PASTA domain-containing protein [Actinomycetota bacterium]